MKLRLSLTALAVLAALSCGLLAGAQVELDRYKDAVSITETVLAGDPAAAAGLTVTASTHCRQHLLWESRFPAGAMDALETRFSFSSTPFREESPFPYIPYLSLDLFSGGFSSSAGIDFAGPDPYSEPMLSALSALFRDVASRAPAGEEYTETVLLNDYYDFLPLSIDVPSHFSSSHYADQTYQEQVLSLLKDYFRIPVPEDTRAEVTIGKDPRGAVHGASFSLADGSIFLDPQTAYVAGAAEDLYFTLCVETSVELDDRLIPGGWGIYCLSLAGDTPSLSTVYSLPEGARAIRFWSSRDYSQLFLLTRVDGMLRLTVLDGAARPLQALDLLPFPEGWHTLSPYLGDGFLMLSAYPGYEVEDLSRPFALLVQGADGLWSVRFLGDTGWMEQQECRLDTGETSYMAFDGARLALTAPLSYRSSDFYLAVYSEAGLEYLGTYHSSLSDSDSNFMSPCQPLYYQPRTLAWEHPE